MRLQKSLQQSHHTRARRRFEESRRAAYIVMSRQSAVLAAMWDSGSVVGYVDDVLISQV